MAAEEEGTTAPDHGKAIVLARFGWQVIISVPLPMFFGKCEGSGRTPVIYEMTGSTFCHEHYSCGRGWPLSNLRARQAK